MGQAEEHFEAVLAGATDRDQRSAAAEGLAECRRQAGDDEGAKRYDDMARELSP